MKVYAYVSSETCTIRRAILPGHEAPNGESVSKHGDYQRWPFGKRETLAMLNLPGAHNSYRREAAGLVADLREWRSVQA